MHKKMPAHAIQHTVGSGVPKREPCQRCQLPVFLAERLTHAGRLYHRTCLRCARCRAQLTPGSFYETEADGQFCCETCPDEEEKTAATTTTPSAKIDADRDAARQSFSHKLALFQARSSTAADLVDSHSSSRTLLSKSLSDEEKSKSLKRLTAMYQQHQVLSEESAVRTSFVRRQLTGKDDDVAAVVGGPATIVVAVAAAETSSEDDDDEDEDDDGEEEADDDDDIQPPALPTVAPPLARPPSIDPVQCNGESHPVKPEPSFEIDTTDAPIVIKPDVASDICVTKPISPSRSVTEEQVEEETKVHDTTDVTESISPSRSVTVKTVEEETTVFTPTVIAAHMDVIEPISPSRSVTKELPVDITESISSSKSVTEKQVEEETTVFKQTVVAAKIDVIEPISPSRSVTKELPVDEATVLEPAATIVEMDSISTSRSVIEELPVEETMSKVVVVVRADEPVLETSPTPPVMPTPRKRAHKPIHTDGDQPAPVPVKPVARERSTVPISPPVEARAEAVPEPTLEDTPPAAPSTLAEKPTSYPEAFNPFGDDDDDGEDNQAISPTPPVQTAVSTTQRRNSYNPFDSSDDEVELDKLATLKATVASTAKLSASLNPFGSDEDDDDDDDVEVRRLADLKRTPVPTPRKVILPPSSSMSASMSTSTPASHHHRSAGSSIHSTPEPQRRPSAHQHPNYHNQRQTVNYLSAGATPSPLHRNSQLYGSVSSLASTASAMNAYTRRYKKRAPLPPSASSSPFSSSTAQSTPNRTAGDISIDGSPSASGRSTPSALAVVASARKKRVAPPPPPTPQLAPIGTDAAIVTSTTPAGAATPQPTVETDTNVPDEPASDVEVDASKVNDLTEKATLDAQHVIEAVLTDQVDHAAAAVADADPQTVEKSETTPATPTAEPMEIDVDTTTTTTPAAAETTGEPDAIVAVELDIVLEPMPSTPPPKAMRQLIPAECDTSEPDEPIAATPLDPNPVPQTPPKAMRKLIPLDASLLDDLTPGKVLNQSYTSAALPADSDLSAEPEVVYRRTIVPAFDEDTADTQPLPESHDRQWQKVKENKESLNKNRQSQCASLTSASSPESQHTTGDRLTVAANGSDMTDCVVDVNTPPEQQQTPPPPPYSNKSTFGKWKRRKATAPLPPPTATSSASIIVQSKGGGGPGGVQMLPLTDIRYELEVIEVQQQGLEKQGIQLEKMIRDRCEGSGAVGSTVSTVADQQQIIEEVAAQNAPNSKEVEDLILQLFEIVNEKNELFRRQAELMYIRRLHRLEQEQADIEYDIRMLMEQPESNKTDSDKAREDGLIARKIEIVLQRNEVIDCLECDRLREAEEDQSIKTRLDEHNARWDEELAAQQLAPVKLSKKEKKKLRETKKLAKQKKVDADKDADESEVGKPAAADAAKKKKRKFLF